MTQLLKLYMKTTHRPLSQYIVFPKKGKISKKAYGLIGLFVVIATWYMFSLFEVVDSYFLTLEIVGIIAIVTLLFPLLYINAKTTGKVVVTTDAFAIQNVFRRFKLYMYKDVAKVKQTRKNNLKIKTQKGRTVIRFSDYDTQLEALKTIFNHMGFFGERKRPHKIFVENNRISVQELTPSIDPQSQTLLERFEDDYYHVAVDELECVLLYNVQINRIRIVDKKHLLLELSHMDIKPNHPTNTKRTAMKTDEGFLLMQDITHIELYTIHKDKAKNVELVGTSLQDLKKIANRSEIQEATFKTQTKATTASFELTQGVRHQRARFTFTTALHGFNELKEPSWFEKKN
jgi:hypothetical protein